MAHETLPALDRDVSIVGQEVELTAMRDLLQVIRQRNMPHRLDLRHRVNPRPDTALVAVDGDDNEVVLGVVVMPVLAPMVFVAGGSPPSSVLLIV